jgi:hypothetical protein
MFDVFMDFTYRSMFLLIYIKLKKRMNNLIKVIYVRLIIKCILRRIILSSHLTWRNKDG